MLEDEAAQLERHARVLFDIDPDGRLAAVNEPDADPPPRLFFARGRTTIRAWVRRDVSAATAFACRLATSELPSWDGEEPMAGIFDRLRSALAEGGAKASASHGPAFVFGTRVGVPGAVETVSIDEANAHVLERFFPYTRSVLAARAPIVAVVRDGAAVAACYSARRRPDACEAGVATEPAFRGQGLASAVVAAWRDAVEAVGATPLYSTSWDNHASRAVAARLGLVPYADTLSLG